MSYPGVVGGSHNQSNRSTDVKKGFLTKRGGFVTSWKSRFFRCERGVLKYYEREHDNVLGSIQIHGAAVDFVDVSEFSREHCFSVKPKETGRKYILQASNPKERYEWMMFLQKQGGVFTGDTQHRLSVLGPGPNQGAQPQNQNGQQQNYASAGPAISGSYAPAPGYAPAAPQSYQPAANFQYAMSPSTKTTTTGSSPVPDVQTRYAVPGRAAMISNSYQHAGDSKTASAPPALPGYSAAGAGAPPPAYQPPEALSSAAAAAPTSKANYGGYAQPRPPQPQQPQFQYDQQPQPALQFQYGVQPPVQMQPQQLQRPVSYNAPAQNGWYQPQPPPGQWNRQQQTQPLPPGWMHATGSDGRTYYYNTVTKTSQWTHPRL